MSQRKPISEADISNLVDAFYRKIRADASIGPIFNRIVEDWPHHLARLKNFWSTVLLTTGAYRGDPLAIHLELPLQKEHFERWLALFAETATGLLDPEHAAHVIRKSEQIAQNFQSAIAYNLHQPVAGDAGRAAIPSHKG